MRTLSLSSLLATAFAFLASFAHASSISVTGVTGDVKVTQSGKTSNLASGSNLTKGATLATGPGGNASIAFSNGTTLSVAPGTVLAIEEYAQRGGAGIVDPKKLTKEPTASRTILNLRKGKITGEVKQLNLPAGSVFKIKTPAGPLSIKGTTIDVSVTETSSGSFIVNYSIIEGSGVVEPITVNAVGLGNGQSVTITIDGDKVVVSDVQNLTPAQVALVNQVVTGLKAALANTTFNTGTSTTSGSFTVQAESTRVTGTEGTANFER